MIKEPFHQVTIFKDDNVIARHNARPKNEPDFHKEGKGLSDAFAKAACNHLFRWANWFFKNNYDRRALVLETVATLPGSIASSHQTWLASRKRQPKNPMIREFMDESENERMHLRIFQEVAKPNRFDRFIIAATHWTFGAIFSAGYIMSPKTAHRFVGYIEEKAVDSYTRYLEEIDAGNMPNPPAPDFAKQYYNLPEDAMLRDVIIHVRNDEMEHRDTNHEAADHLAEGHNINEMTPPSYHYQSASVATSVNRQDLS